MANPGLARTDAKMSCHPLLDLLRMKPPRSQSICSLLACLILAIPLTLPGSELNVRDFGAVGDEAVLDHPAIQAALDQAASQGGGVVRIPSGTYRIGASLRVPSGVHLTGDAMEATRLVASAGLDFDLLLLENVEKVRISNLTLEELDRNFRATGDGVAVHGNSNHILVDRVSVYGFRSSFGVGRDDQGTASNVTFRDCYAEGARNWGFEFNNVRAAAMDNCLTFRNRLDGIKLRRQARNVQILGGESSHNGQGGRQVGGSGIDAYAGGESFLLQDFVAEHNNGGGIYIKTGPLQYQEFGEVARGLISGVRVRYNAGSGLDLNRSGGDRRKDGEDRLPPLSTQFTVIGGIFEENEASGIYIRGRNVSLISPIARSNEGSGIQINSGWDISILNPLIAGNGTRAPGRIAGIFLSGTHGGNRVLISGGVIDGIDDRRASDGLDLEEVAPVQGMAMRFSEESSEVILRHPVLRHWAESSGPIRNEMADTNGLLAHYGVQSQAQLPGGPGSTIILGDRLRTRAPGRIAWVPVLLSFDDGNAAAPGLLQPGDQWFDPQRGRPLWWDGGDWSDSQARR